MISIVCTGTANRSPTGNLFWRILKNGRLRYLGEILRRAAEALGEILLFLTTFPGPWIFLALVLVTNVYLAVKPIAHNFFSAGCKSYGACFRWAKLDVARAYRWIARTYFDHQVRGGNPLLRRHLNSEKFSGRKCKLGESRKGKKCRQ